MVRLPDIRRALHVSNATLGLFGLLAALGALIGLGLANRIIQHFGSRRAILWGFVASPVGFIVEAVAVQSRWNHATVIVGVGYFTLGTFLTFTDIGVNVDGAAIERHLDRSILPRLHGSFSLGSFAGAGLGTLCEAVHISLATQVIAVACAMALTPLTTYRFLPPRQIRNAPVLKSTPRPHWREWFDRDLLFIAGAIFFLAMAEGAATSWLTLAVVQGEHQSVVIAGESFITFNAAMVLMRLSGGRLVDRFGPVRILQLLALVALSGIACLLLWQNALASFIGAALWGLGVSLSFPVCISFAGRTPRLPARRVLFVSTFGYAAFLVGPPLLGFAAQSWGILHMLYIVMSALVIAGALVHSAKNVEVRAETGLHAALQ